MFPNVRVEMARRDMNISQLSEATKIPLQRLSTKLSGKRKLTFDEAVNIKNALGCDMSLDELFKRKDEA